MPQVAKFILIYGPDPVWKHQLGNELRRILLEHHVYTVQDSREAPLRHLVASGLGDKFADIDPDAMQPELLGHRVAHLMSNLREVLEDCYGEDTLDRWLHRRILRNIPVPVFTVVDDATVSSFDCLKPHVIIGCGESGTIVDAVCESQHSMEMIKWARKFVASLLE